VTRESDKQPKSKRPYQKPKLQEYGSVAKLTMTKGSTSTEAGVPKKKKFAS
jgi:hypothetical protein